MSLDKDWKAVGDDFNTVFREIKRAEQMVLHIVDTLPELYQFLTDHPHDDICFIQSKKSTLLVTPRNETTRELCALFDDAAFKDLDIYKGRILEQILRENDIKKTHEIIYEPTIMGDTKIILRPKAQEEFIKQKFVDYYRNYGWSPYGG